jgi:hypothetical protein
LDVALGGSEIGGDLQDQDALPLDEGVCRQGLVKRTRRDIRDLPCEVMPILIATAPCDRALCG